MEAINRGKRWTQKDDEFLENSWGFISKEKIAEKLGRTVRAIESRASILGLGRYQEAGGLYINPNRIAEMLGKKSCVVYNWIKSGKLKAKKRKSNVKTTYQVSMDDLKDFLEKNQELWDSRNLELYALGEEPEWLKEKRKRDIKEPVESRKRWTKAEDNLLIEYAKQGLSKEEIAKKLNRTIKSIKCRMSKKRKKGEPIPVEVIMLRWKEEEIKLMMKLEKKGYTDEEIAYELGRDRASVSGLRYRLRKKGLYKGYKKENVNASS